MKQSAVEWLSNEFYEKFEMKGDGALINDLVNQAKEIEKQQQDEFSINFLHWYLNNDDIKKFSYSYENLLKTYKKEKTL